MAGGIELGPFPPQKRKEEDVDDGYHELESAAPSLLAAPGASARAAARGGGGKRPSASRKRPRVPHPLPDESNRSSSTLPGGRSRIPVFPPHLHIPLTSVGSDISDWRNLHHPHLDEPDIAHFSQLLAALLLTTGLSLISALDAKEQCQRHEAYALLDLVDDDNFQKAYDTALENDESVKCVQMFNFVLVPTFAITFGLGSIALVLLYLYSRRLHPQNQLHHLLQLQIPLYARRALRLTGELLVLCLGVLCAQTYNIMAVMLRPRVSSEDDNPYISLAAVDVYGHVGINANLYYLSWMSEGLALALVYQLVTAFGRLYRTAAGNQHHSKNNTGTNNEGPTPLALLSSPSGDAIVATFDSDCNGTRESRAMWFQSLYRLRFRTGTWVAALLACLVVVASSHIYYATSQYSNDGDGEQQQEQQQQQQEQQFRERQVCQMVSQAGESPQLCRRTAAAWFSGLIASGLCATAIGMHLAARHGAASTTTPHDYDQHNLIMWEKVFVKNRLHLRTELLLCVLISLLLGFNAFFCTGVQGPAATVGNLYYASWLSFLLVVRICLGCVEEYYNIGDDTHKKVEAIATTTTATTPRRQTNGVSGTYEAPSMIENDAEDEGRKNMQTSLSQVSNQSTMTDLLEKNRVKRLRTYFFLCIFSSVCAASAFDAASNQKKKLSHSQAYMILSPCIVAVLSALLFVLCLSKRCYLVASHFLVGGLVSLLSFGLWLLDLVLTMHSEDSWAVDGIGSLKNGNLYYFSWAGIITSGLQMMSYVKAFFSVTQTDYMIMVWIAICKVCFVILGAALHIWHTISDNCEFDEIAYGAVTFCSRTVLAMIVALVGMLVGGLVVLARVFLLYCSRCNNPCMIRVQAHVEMLISMFLLLLFGATVALITGIGGPGQSVGDLYYSTWLSFWVALAIFVSCESEVREQQQQHQQPSTPAAADKIDQKHYAARDTVLV